MKFENFYLDKKGARILALSTIGVCGALIFLIYWEVRNSPSPSKQILKEGKSLHFNGVIDSIYYEERNHNAEVWVLSNGYRYATWWSYIIKKGDSVSKARGDSKIFVYYKNGKRKILDYKILVKDFN